MTLRPAIPKTMTSASGIAMTQGVPACLARRSATTIAGNTMRNEIQ